MNEDILFEEMIAKHDERVKREIAENKHIGFKSHIATRAGLNVQP